jgi:hypothetical protein
MATEIQFSLSLWSKCRYLKNKTINGDVMWQLPRCMESLRLYQSTPLPIIPEKCLPSFEGGFRFHFLHPSIRLSNTMVDPSCCDLVISLLRREVHFSLSLINNGPVEISGPLQRDPCRLGLQTKVAVNYPYDWHI